MCWLVTTARAPQIPLNAAPVRLLEVEDHQVVMVPEQCPGKGEARLAVRPQSLHDRLQGVPLGVEEPFVQV